MRSRTLIVSYLYFGSLLAECQCECCSCSKTNQYYFIMVVACLTWKKAEIYSTKAKILYVQHVDWVVYFDKKALQKLLFLVFVEIKYMIIRYFGPPMVSCIGEDNFQKMFTPTSTTSQTISSIKLIFMIDRINM